VLSVAFYLFKRAIRAITNLLKRLMFVWLSYHIIFLGFHNCFVIHNMLSLQIQALSGLFHTKPLVWNSLFILG